MNFLDLITQAASDARGGTPTQVNQSPSVGSRVASNVGQFASNNSNSWNGSPAWLNSKYYDGGYDEWNDPLNPYNDRTWISGTWGKFRSDLPGQEDYAKEQETLYEANKPSELGGLETNASGSKSDESKETTAEDRPDTSQFGDEYNFLYGNKGDWERDKFLTDNGFDGSWQDFQFSGDQDLWNRAVLGNEDEGVSGLESLQWARDDIENNFGGDYDAWWNYRMMIDPQTLGMYDTDQAYNDWKTTYGDIDQWDDFNQALLDRGYQVMFNADTPSDTNYEDWINQYLITDNNPNGIIGFNANYGMPYISYADQQDALNEMNQRALMYYAMNDGLDNISDTQLNNWLTDTGRNVQFDRSGEVEGASDQFMPENEYLNNAYLPYIDYIYAQQTNPKDYLGTVLNANDPNVRWYVSGEEK